MKRIIFCSFIIIMMFCCDTFAQQFNHRNNTPDNIPNLIKKHNVNDKSTLVWKWDTIICYNSLNSPIYRYTKTYDINGNVLTYLQEIRQNNDWVNFYIFIYTYNNNKKQTEYYKLWKNNVWVNSYRETYSYDSNGNILTNLLMYFPNNANPDSVFFKDTFTYDSHNNKLSDLNQEKWQNNNWVIKSKHTYSYDSNDNMLIDLYEQWNWQDSIWNNNIRITNTYDIYGNNLTYLNEEWQGNTWVNKSLYTYAYDINGNLLTKLFQQWSNMWNNGNLDTYTYDNNNNMLTDIYQMWNNGSWINLSKNTYTNDTNGNILIKLYEYFENNVWKAYKKYSFTYDVYGNTLTEKVEQLNNGNWLPMADNLIYYNNESNILTFSMIYRFDVYYTSFSTYNIENRKYYSNITIYPNPTKETLNITNAEKGDIHIYNVLGEEVETRCITSVQYSRDVINRVSTINVSKLTSGTYIVKIVSAKGVVVKQLIINN